MQAADYDEIVPNLFLGNLEGARDLSFLTKNDINYVLENKESELFNKQVKKVKKVENIDYCLNVPHIDTDKTNIPTGNPNDEPNCSDTKIKLINAMCEFADANRRNEWPKSTSIWCRWCAHPFSGPPVSLPKWYINKTFFVSGCYCSYSCAAKHLFSRGDIDENDKWKYYNLLHLLRKRILKTNEISKIKLAPPQETLKVFG